MFKLSYLINYIYFFYFIIYSFLFYKGLIYIN